MHIIYFYLTALIAVITTISVILSRNAVHALLNFIVSLLSVAIIFYQFGASFAAALEVIVYAGAIMVLMVFVIMMLNQGEIAVVQESQWMNSKNWIIPGVLSGVLLAQFISMLGWLDNFNSEEIKNVVHYVSPKSVGIALFSKYVLAVELASMLLLSGLVGAFHLSRYKINKSDMTELTNGT